MPGLIGFVKDLGSERAGELLRQMADALEPENRFQRDLYHEARFGLGRVSLGILNPEPQPIWNEDQTIGLVMEGEFYADQDLKRQLVERGHRFQTESDAELALHLYEDYGRDFAVRLNGAFAIAIWDRRTQQLVLVNDRLGLYPLYYAWRSGALVFASGVRAILADPSVPRQVDRTAMAELLTFDHVLHQRTLLEDVRLLPQASVLTCHAGQLDLHRYWTVQYAETYPLRNEDAYREELIHLLRQAMKRQAHDDLPAGLLLSGGMDSRALLGLLAECANGQALTTFTWSIPGSDDARFADEVARQVGAQHHFFELKPDWLLEKAEACVRRTDGMGNVVNLHASATLEAESQYAKVIYKGFMGDAMFGFGLRPRHWADYDDATRLQVHLEAYRDYNVFNFDLPQHPHLFTEAFQRQVGNGLLDDYQAAIVASGVTQLANQRLYIDLTNRVPRMTINGVEVVRERAAVRLPFCDNDLVEFCFRIPPGLQMGRQLFTRTFIQAFPHLAQIPATPSNLPLVACAREVMLRAQELIQWHLRNRSLGWLAGPMHRPYKDYTAWFRTILRPWVEENLLSPTSLERGYFNPDYVRQVVQDHMAGRANHAGRLGALLSLELWHKQFLD